MTYLHSNLQTAQSSLSLFSTLKMNGSQSVEAEKEEMPLTVANNNIHLNELFPDIANPKCLAQKPKTNSNDESSPDNKRRVTTLMFDPSCTPCEKKAKVLEESEDYVEENDEEESAIECMTSITAPAVTLNLSPEENKEGKGKHITTLSFDPSKTQKMLMCNVCHKNFASESQLEAHRQTHENVVVSKSPVKSADTPSSKSDQQMLQAKWERWEAVSQSEFPFKCPECGKTFGAKSYLKAHWSVHTGEKPYRCEQCDKRFRVMSNFYKHVRRMHE